MGKSRKDHWDEDEEMTKSQLRRDRERRQNKRLKSALKTKNIDALIESENY